MDKKDIIRGSRRKILRGENLETDLIEFERLILRSCGEAWAWAHWSGLSVCLWRLLARACWMELDTQSRESRLLAARILLPGGKQVFRS